MKKLFFYLALIISIDCIAQITVSPINSNSSISSSFLKEKGKGTITVNAQSLILSYGRYRALLSNQRFGNDISIGYFLIDDFVLGFTAARSLTTNDYERISNLQIGPFCSYYFIGSPFYFKTSYLWGNERIEFDHVYLLQNLGPASMSSTSRKNSFRNAVGYSINLFKGLYINPSLFYSRDFYKNTGNNNHFNYSTGYYGFNIGIMFNF